ncbi:hypothetical protein PF003_g15396 [Phytophthora fragariae]|nr:hypothetical protein PF003_g15396 [Phytophthora fragariae]
MSSGGQSYGGYGGAYYPPPVEYGGYGGAREETPPGRRPNGFIPVYTGAEVRRSDSPAYGWNQLAWPVPPHEPPRPFGWTPSTGWSTAPVANAPAKVVIKKETTKKPTAKKAATVATTATPTKPSTVPAPPKKKKSTKNGGIPANKGGMTTGVNAWNAAPFPAQPTATVPVNSISVSQATSHVVKVLPIFYSDLTTVERARTFWEAFEENTEGLPDKSRLLVFQQKLKGREAERWWNNSHIKTFKTLKVRFHNHFLSRTADELWERLHSTKRQKGESIEEWGDRVTDLCESLDYPDARMRYQLFRRGLNNRRMLAILDSSPARDIPEACEWLMVKDMYRPVDEDEDFEEAAPAKSAAASETPAILKPMVDQVKALAQEVRSFVKGEQEWRNKVNNELRASPQPHYVMQTMATVPSVPPPPMQQQPPWNGQGFRGIRMDDDGRDQEGAPICGRCQYRGHGRANCRRQSFTCRRCNQFGHMQVECEQPPPPQQQPGGFSGGNGNSRSWCSFCQVEGHTIGGCPTVKRLRDLDAKQQAEK